MKPEHPPLTPPDCNLRDFPFIPLEINRLRRSKSWLKAKRNPALAFYQINLWTAAWHDVPAGSLEDDEDVLADLAMCDPAKWLKVRDEVMRGWIKCSDGRLYNPTVCEKALESWAAKVERRDKDEHERDRKRREREDRARMFAELKDAGYSLPWNAPTTELRQLVTDLSRGQVRDSHGQRPPESRLRERQGQGQGQGELNKSDSGGVGSPNVVDPVDNSESPPLSGDEIGKHLAQWEVDRGKALRLNQHARDELLRFAERSVSEPQLRAAYRLACDRRERQQDASPINPAFVASFLDEALDAGLTAGVSLGWDETPEGVQAMADKLALAPQRADEHPIWFRRRVIKASGDQRLIERAVSEAERMNLSEYERVHRFLYGMLPGQAAA